MRFFTPSGLNDTREEGLMRDLSDADREWQRLNTEALEHARNNDWGLYTNTQLDKADHLKREGLPKRELELLLSVLYLEANGPENRGGVDPELLREFPPFDPSMALIPPALAARASALFEGLGLTGEQAHAMFIDVATRHRNKLMPVSPAEAWDAMTQTPEFRSLP